MRHYELSIRPFRQVACDKEQALKPLEEAAEIYGATMSRDGETWECDYDCMFGAGFDDIH